MEKPYTPYSRQHLADRRDALARGRRTPVNIGRATVAALLTSGAIAGASFVGQHLPGDGEHINPITRELDATPQADKQSKIFQICLRGLSEDQLPVGFPKCSEVLGKTPANLQASVRP